MKHQRPSRPSVGTGAPRGWSGAAPFHAARWAPVLALAALTYVLYPVSRTFDAPVVESGQVAPAEVLAPFEFLVRKSPQEAARDAEALAATVRPIYVYQSSIVDSVRRRTDGLFAQLDAANSSTALIEAGARFGARLTPEEAQFFETRARRAAFRASLSRFLQRQLTHGVAPRGTIEQELSRDVVVRRDGRERVIPRDSVLSYGAFLERRSREYPAPNSSVGDQLFLKLINAVFEATLEDVPTHVGVNRWYPTRPRPRRFGQSFGRAWTR